MTLHQEFHRFSVSFVWDFSLEHNFGIPFILKIMLLDVETLTNVWSKPSALK